MKKIICSLMMFIFVSLGMMLPAQTQEPIQMRSIQELESIQQYVPVFISPALDPRQIQSPVVIVQPANVMISLCLLIIVLLLIIRIVLVVTNRGKEQSQLEEALARRRAFESLCLEKIEVLKEHIYKVEIEGVEIADDTSSGNDPAEAAGGTV